MNQLLTPGQTAYRQWGALNIRIDRHHEGVTITVDHHPTLNRQFLNLDEGRNYVAFLRDEAKAGKPVWAIEAGAGALTSAAAVFDQAERDLIDSINATLDEEQAAGQVEADRLAADVAAIMAGSNIHAAGVGTTPQPSNTTWTALRQQATTRAAVTSEPMDRVLASAVDGFIPRTREATSAQLIALSRRGLVELVYGRQGNRRVITGARLTGKGSKKAVAA